MFSYDIAVAVFSRSRFDFHIKHENKNTARIIGFLFILRPTPSPRLSLIRRPQIIPRPRAEGGAGGDDDRVAGGMMIAGGHAFPFRSLAIARSLFHIHCVGLGCAPFSSAHSFAVPSREGGGDDGVAVIVSRLSARPAVRVLVSPLYLSFIVHPCRSKQEASAFLRLPRLPRASPRQILRPLPVASFTSPIPSRSSSRLASRRPSRSHVVSSHRPVPIPFLSCPMCRTLASRLAVAPFCSAHLAVLPMPCRHRRLMTG